MLLFNLFGNNDENCVNFVRCLSAIGGTFEDFWVLYEKRMKELSRKDEEKLIKEYGKIFIVISGTRLNDLKSFYYLEVIRYLKEHGEIDVYVMIDDGVILPPRYRWLLTEGISQIAFY